MAQAKRDENRVTVALAVSTVDDVTTQMIQINPVTKGVIVEIAE